MWLPLIAIAGGLVALVWSADRFVDAASRLALRIGVTPLVIGLTIVAFGTSAPEIAVSLLASVAGNPGLAIGNAVGSNITNIGLVLGLAALFVPVAVAHRLLRRELPLLLLVSVATLVLVWDGQLQRSDGVLLLVAFAAFMVWLGVNARRGATPPGLIEAAPDAPDAESVPGSLTKDLAWIIGGLVLLVLASRALVWGAVEIATLLGVSDLVIGLTIVAIGTSLPELATTLMAALKKETDLAIGNVVGSNMFNTLLVLPMPALFAPGAIDPSVTHRDVPMMLGFTLLLTVFALLGRGTKRVSRLEGGLLLALFVGYVVWLILTARAP